MLKNVLVFPIKNNIDYFKISHLNPKFEKIVSYLWGAEEKPDLRIVRLLLGRGFKE